VQDDDSLEFVEARVAEGSGGKVSPAGGDRQGLKNALAKLQIRPSGTIRAVLFFALLKISASSPSCSLDAQKDPHMTAGATYGPAKNQIALRRI